MTAQPVRQIRVRRFKLRSEIPGKSAFACAWLPSALPGSCPANECRHPGQSKPPLLGGRERLFERRSPFQDNGGTTGSVPAFSPRTVPAGRALYAKPPLALRVSVQPLSPAISWRTFFLASAWWMSSCFRVARVDRCLPSGPWTVRSQWPAWPISLRACPRECDASPRAQTRQPVWKEPYLLPCPSLPFSGFLSLA